MLVLGFMCRWQSILQGFFGKKKDSCGFSWKVWLLCFLIFQIQRSKCALVRPSLKNLQSLHFDKSVMYLLKLISFQNKHSRQTTLDPITFWHNVFFHFFFHFMHVHNIGIQIEGVIHKNCSCYIQNHSSCEGSVLSISVSQRRLANFLVRTNRAKSLGVNNIWYIFYLNLSWLYNTNKFKIHKRML